MLTGSIRVPRLANVEYADAISRTDTSSVPSTSEAFGASDDFTPSWWGMSARCCDPMAVSSCAYTVLTDWAVASIRLTEGPASSFSKLVTGQSAPLSALGMITSGGPGKLDCTL